MVYMKGYWSLKRKGMFKVFFFIPLFCLSGCNNFNQSIDDFIDGQTGMVELQDFTPGTPGTTVLPDGSILIPLGAARAPEFILELNLQNKWGYTLDFAVLNTDGTKPDPAAIWVESGEGGQVFIHIAGAQPGDEFNLTLKLWKADGQRTFADIAIPPIVFERERTPAYGEGSISVTFSGTPQDENIEFTGTTGDTLDWAGGFLNLTAPTTGVFSGAAYQWYRDGQEIAGETTSSYGVAGNTFTLARHQVMVRITTSTGIVYSKALTFTVQ
jgi:hypothetical protein